MKLEDSPGKADFKVPDKYFDELPTRIQARLTNSKSPGWHFTPRFALRYALPLIGLFGIGLLWYNQSNQTIIGQLENIDEAQLSFFIDDPDLTSEELVENVTWSADDLETLEHEVYDVLDASGETLDVVIDELELENL
jgi:hypothetical protein